MWRRDFHTTTRWTIACTNGLLVAVSTFQVPMNVLCHTLSFRGLRIFFFAPYELYWERDLFDNIIGSMNGSRTRIGVLGELGSVDRGTCMQVDSNNLTKYASMISVSGSSLDGDNSVAKYESMIADSGSIVGDAIGRWKD